MGFLRAVFGGKKGNARVFVSFAKEDAQYRDFVVMQARNKRSPFEFMDMSIKEPYPETVWKDRCRAKIRRCDGMIVLLSKHTYHSSGARWEIKCAREERVRVMGMHIRNEDRGAIPPELKGKKIVNWNWENLQSFINSCKP
ncbi:MAG: TIR domain-containing protein [Bacteroidetes bacterium]|nr:TIR domain-containing protein [Bacteroidota bacterium]